MNADSFYQVIKICEMTSYSCNLCQADDVGLGRNFFEKGLRTSKLDSRTTLTEAYFGLKSNCAP